MNGEKQNNQAPRFIPCGDAFEKMEEIIADASEKGDRPADEEK